jgi:signal transduction histidine kinase/ActR/RegA family two-component response regulator
VAQEIWALPETKVQCLSKLSLDQEIRNLTGIGTWEWDIEKQSMVWSSEACRIFEIDAGSPVAPSDMPMFRSPAANGVEAEVIREALRSGTPWKIVHPAITARGREIWIRSTGHVDRVDGRSVRLFGLFQDVTDEQKAKAELERSRVLLEEMSSLSGVGGWEYDPATNRVSWSRETRRIHEVDDSFEPTPESLQDFFAPGALEIQAASVQRATMTGLSSECEYEVVTAKRRAIRVRNISKVEKIGEHITRLVGTVQDITRQSELERTLGRTESLLEEISQLTGVGGWEVSVPSGNISWTPQLRRIFEANDDLEPTNEVISKLLAPEVLARISSAIRDAAQLARPFDIEYDARTLRGNEVRLRSIGHAEQVDGQTVRVVGTLEDVTAQRKAEAERRRDEALNEQVSRLAGIGGWEFDVRTKETIWSPQVRKIFEVGETYNPPLEDHPKFVAPESSEAAALLREQAVEQGLPAEFEFQALTATGRRIWVRHIFQAERVNGRAIRLFGTTQDVTAEREAKAELELLHTRLKVAIEAAELRVWEIDLETGVMQWDSHAPLTFAAPEMGQTLRASSVLDFIHPEDRDAFAQQANEVVLSDVPSVSRVRARAPDGSFRHVEIRMCLTSQYADRRKIIGVSRDVTRDVTLNEELVRKRREAEEASLAKSQFVARMSHEIRTPMSGVIGMLEVLQRAEVDQTKRAHAVTALKSARDLMSVLDDIIDASQLESRHLALDGVPFSPSTVVDDVVSLFSALARDKSLTLTAAVEGSVPAWVMGDARRVRQVLTNLVGNAVKFTDAGKVEIAVIYDADQQVARFSVRDTGAGIPDDMVDKVFDQFFQVDSSTTRRHSGSGLGLAISRQLVSMMGGTIQVDSRLGEGSVFDFTIAAPAAAPPSPERVEPLAAPSKSLRVLVAEDNAAMQKILHALLETGGHHVTVVSDGRDAVAMAASQTFDVVLMDVMMPTMDGTTAAQRIRELGGRAGGIPIIALTANALVGDRDRYLAAGMTDYLSKPIDVAALFAALDRVAAGA